MLGVGAGGYEQHWLADRPFEHKVRDAHNLYLETVAELGPLGLALLLLALGAPIAAAVAARRQPASCRCLRCVLRVPRACGDRLGLGARPSSRSYLRSSAGRRCWLRREREDRPLQLGAGPWRRGRRTLVIAASSSARSSANKAIAGSDAAADDANWAQGRERGTEGQALGTVVFEPWQRLGEAHIKRAFAAAEQDFREAIERDPRDFELWLGLARATDGAERAAALRRATELNPFSPEIEDFRAG